MAKVCDVCGRGPQFGNRISHAHNVTKRRWNLNLQAVRAVVNGASKRIRVCTSCIKSGKIQKAAYLRAVSAALPSAVLKPGQGLIARDLRPNRLPTMRPGRVF